MAVPKNTAFETALKIHLDAWASDPRSFRDTSTLAEMLLEVKRFEEAHSLKETHEFAETFSRNPNGTYIFYQSPAPTDSDNPQTISHLRKRGLHLQLQGQIGRAHV